MKAILIATLVASLAAAASASHAEVGPLFHFAAAGTTADLKTLEGKRVLGKSRELLGRIGNVDERRNTAELKIPSGAVISLSTDWLSEDGEDLSAPFSLGDIIAMIDKPGEERTVRQAGAGAPVPP